jgi:hypothetical protein
MFPAGGGNVADRFTEVTMLSRTILSVLALSSVLAVAPRAGADAGDEMPYGAACPSPFNSGSVTSVSPYRTIQTNLKHSSTRLEGAVINVQARPGLTREWLQRQVDEASASPQGGCPLAVNGASGRVSSTGSGFAITVSSPDRDSAREILRRAQTLASQ